MKRTTGIMPIGLLVIFLTAIFAGPATAALIEDSDFNASGNYNGSSSDYYQTSSVNLRTDGDGQDWFESRASVPEKLMLYSNTASGIYGNYTNLARLRNHGTDPGFAFLTQDFDSAQTGRFSISFDIAVGYLHDDEYDRTGMIYIGDKDTEPPGAGGPNNSSAERFVYLGFYDQAPGDHSSSDQKLQLKANYGADDVTGENSLFYDTWYTITLDIDVACGTYDVTVDETYDDHTTDVITTLGVAANADLDSLTHLSFATGTTGNGTFYVDNVSAVPIPGSLLLLGSGIVGLVAIRRRLNG